MRILHHRPTRHFVALLVRCRCGRKFLHRFDRLMVACLACGRLDELERLIEKLRTERDAGRRRVPRAALRSGARR